MFNNENQIVIRLQGGIGNQLFQYFAGLHLSQLKGAKLILEKQELNHIYTLHPGNDIEALDLPGIFRTTGRNPLSFHATRLLNSATRRVKLVRRFRNRFKREYLSPEIGFDKCVLELNTPISISGYFQSWKYLEGSCLPKNSIFKNYHLSGEWILAESQHFSSKPIIVVHIRLGDFLDSKNSYFGNLAEDYYAKSISYLKELGLEYEIAIFSDNPKLAKEIFNSAFPASSRWIEPPEFVDPLDILKLMSLGRVFIIANSTFSWWAAMLSFNPEVVLAPKKWFEGREDPTDLIPLNWVRIESNWRKIEKTS